MSISQSLGGLVPARGTSTLLNVLVPLAGTRGDLHETVARASAFCFASLCTFPTRPIKALRHCLNRLHHLFQHRFLLKKYHLARCIIKRILRNLQPLVNEQEKMSTIRRPHLLYLSPQVLRMPEADQLD